MLHVHRKQCFIVSQIMFILPNEIISTNLVIRNILFLQSISKFFNISIHFIPIMLWNMRDMNMTAINVLLLRLQSKTSLYFCAHQKRGAKWKRKNRKILSVKVILLKPRFFSDIHPSTPLMLVIKGEHEKWKALLIATCPRAGREEHTFWRRWRKADHIWPAVRLFPGSAFTASFVQQTTINPQWFVALPNECFFPFPFAQSRTPPANMQLILSQKLLNCAHCMTWWWSSRLC